MVIRFFSRFIILGVLALMLGLLAAWMMRERIAETLIHKALAGAGYENASFDVADLSLQGITLERVTLSASHQSSSLTENNVLPAVSIDTVSVAYDWWTLLRDRRVRAITIGPGRLVAIMDEAGTITVPGLVLASDKNTSRDATRSAFDPANLPLDTIVIDPILLVLKTPQGTADGRLEGGYSVNEGGALTVTGQAAIAGVSEYSVNNANVTLNVDLSATGEFSAETDLRAQLVTPYGTINGFSLGVNGAGGDWIKTIETGFEALEGEFLIDLESAQIPITDLPVPGKGNELDISVGALTEDSDSIGRTEENSVDFLADFLGDERAERVSVNGAMILALKPSGISLKPVISRPIEVRTNLGDRLAVSGLNESPILSIENDTTNTGFAVALETRKLTLSGHVETRQTVEGEVSFSGALTLPEQTLGTLADQDRIQIETLNLNVEGNQNAGRVDMVATLEGQVTHVERPPFDLRSLAFDGDRFRVQILPAPLPGQPIMVIAGVDKNDRQDRVCIDVGKLRVLLPAEQMDASVQTAKVCANGSPLLTVTNLSPLQAQFRAKTQALTARYAQGDTLAQGRPPRFNLQGEWDSATQALSLGGQFNDGDAIINDLVRVSNPHGTINASIINDTMTATATLETVRIAHTQSPVMISPVEASGRLAYEDDKALFEARVAAFTGELLGVVSGRHNITTGMGQIDTRVPDLTFFPDGVQPADILPFLKGQIGNTTGSVSGIASLSWGPQESDITSRAEITAKNLTFRGPGQAVSSTGEVNGTLRFSNLIPATSDGVQTIDIGFVDLDAVRLENGRVRLEFPGNDMISILEGEFPWFGGTIGAYDTSASLAGETISTALRASDVDLSQFLSFLDVEGLSGEGQAGGVLPIIVEDGRIRIENGELRATTPGVIRFDTAVTREIAKENEQVGIAFDVLRELTFDTFVAKINGALDGQLKVGLVFEGTNAITIQGNRVPSPVIYRITIEGPLPNLLSQRMQFTNFSFDPDASTRESDVP